VRYADESKADAAVAGENCHHRPSAAVAPSRMVATVIVTMKNRGIRPPSFSNARRNRKFRDGAAEVLLIGGRQEIRCS
jgi:hypothetical protein